MLSYLKTSLNYCFYIFFTYLFPYGIKKNYVGTPAAKIIIKNSDSIVKCKHL